MREDRRRLREIAKGDPRLGAFLLFSPSYQAVWLHRWSHYFFYRGNRLLARLLWHINLGLTGADISPISNVEGGFVLLYPLCVILVGKAGRNLTVYGQVGIGGGISSADIGAGPGLPVLGNDVTLEFGSLVLGPINVGDNVRLGARCVITTGIPEGSVVESKKPKIRQAQPIAGELQNG